jgi:alpha-D-xyloside xylohydrolase
MALDPLALRRWRPNEVRVLEAGPQGVLALADGIPVALAAYGPRTVRLRIGSPQGRDYGILASPRPFAFSSVAVQGGGVRARVGNLQVDLDLEAPRLSLVWEGREVLRSSTDGHISGGLRVPFLARGEGVWSVAFALKVGEPVYGLGEKFGPLNRRGQLVTCWNEDALGVNAERSYKNVPFLWSPGGWGLFAHTTARSHHGVGYPQWSHRSYILVVEDEGLDLFLMAGSPGEILQAYADLTGQAAPVPRWSLGVWWSRCYYRTAEEALEVARELRRRRIPGDVLVLDGRAWLEVETRCTLEWDRKRYPDPAAFVAEVRSLGYRLCLWEYPYVSIYSSLFPELARKGFFLRDAQGHPYVYRWDPEPFGELLTPLPPSGILDFTQEEAVRWWQERHRNLFALGVEVMKTDFGEQVPEDAFAANGDSGKHLHNAYPLLYNRAVWEATPERLVFARSAYAGSHRYPVVWGGDPQADWDGLAASLRGGLSWGLSGGPYYAHDIGGFYGKPDGELYVRWVQAATFFSHMRFHGTSPREPWFFGEEVERIVRAWLGLRMRLIPYLEASLHRERHRGLPLVKALPLVFPDDPWARAFDEVFIVGEDLLVAPVVRPGGEVEIYLPAGRWYDLWTGDAYEGPYLLRQTCPLERIPVFAREGAVLPIGCFASRAEEVALDGVLLVGEGALGPHDGTHVLGNVDRGFTLDLLLFLGEEGSTRGPSS